MTENHVSVRKLILLPRSKSISYAGLRAQEGEEVCGNRSALNLFWLVAAGQVVIARLVGGQLLKDMVLSLPVSKVCIGNAAGREMGLFLPNLNQPVRFVVWQRAQEHCFDDAKNRAVSPNAYGQRQD